MAKRANERSGICGICSAGCGVVVSYDEEGRIVAVRADESSPFGMICKAGERSPDIIYSKNRIPYPLRRSGPKGSYEFQRISWDEAYVEIVANLMKIKEESGPEAAAVYTGSGSFDRALCDVFQPAGVAVSSASTVLFPYGSPNTLGVGALCYVAFAIIAPHVTMGGMYIDMFADIDRANLVLVWGKNPAAHCPPDDFLKLEAAYRRGAEIIVIDPRRTAVARYPNALWVPIRPGTDGCLALGMCNVLIEEELHDEAFAEKWAAGFDEFNAYVQHFRPDYVESVTGVPSEMVRSLARKLASADGAAPVMYAGLEYNGNGVQTVRAVHTLVALAGQLDVPGGLCFKMRQNRFPLNREGLINNPNVLKAAGHNQFPLYTKYRGEFHAIALPRAVIDAEPYRIRMLLSLGASIVTSWPQSAIWRKTLAGLDFLVCIDRQWTADMAYADIVLPATTYYENESYMVYDSVFKIRERLIEPVGEARYDFFIMSELASCLCYGHLYPQTSEQLLSHVLAGSGFTLRDVRNAGGVAQVKPAMMQYKKWEKGLLREDGKPGFETPTAKFEIASSLLEEYGYDPLPRFMEPRESPSSRPELAARFPLVFNSGAHHNVDLNNLHHSIDSLARDLPAPTVMINEADAAKRGIASGDKVVIRTMRGEVEMYAAVTADIVQGAIEASGSGGGALGADVWKKACVNDLTDLDNFDPISGFPAYKALLCDVQKAEQQGERRIVGTGEYAVDSRKDEAPPAAPIYLDHNATTSVDGAVREAMIEALDLYGNPSSIYSAGREVHARLEAARKSLSVLINCTPRRLIFTSGGSEGNNFVIKGVALRDSKRHIVTTAIEHPSVLQTCRWLEGLGFSVSYVGVGRDGVVDPEDVAKAITGDTCLVSVMAANNETGSLQPVEEIAALARKKGILFHVDAVQAVGKIPLDVQAWGVDFLTLSAHKFHGPKGAGAVYVRKGVEVPDPLIHGGKQEGALRGGTENSPAIIGMGRAAHLAVRRLDEMQRRVAGMRDALYEGIVQLLPETMLNGHPRQRLPNTLNVALPGIRGESLVLALDSLGVFFSSGSACKSGAPEPSHVLLAMGLSEDEAHCSVRFSLGVDNTEEEIERAVRLISETIHTSIGNVRFVSCR